MSKAFCSSAAVLLCLTLFCPFAKADEKKDLEHQLRTIYQNKLLSLRSPYFGSLLTFDSSGVLLNRQVAGPWSTCGLIQAKKIRLNSDAIQIDGKRVLLVLRPGVSDSTTKAPTLEAAPMATDEDVHIRIETSSLNIQSINSALVHAFEGGSLLERVAAYWKPFLPDIKNSASSPPRVVGMLEENRPVYSGSSQIQAPRAIYTPDPEYSDAARRSGLQGVALVQLIVNENGFPEVLEIVRSLGQGLDLEAILAVSHWKFQPALRDGKPLAVVINVEVTFKLR